ncbi:hypothetical protein KJL62_001988 [Campylobacter jejuni]|nr:hypothetical protein [Campylobacter jejuni]
MFVGFSKNLGNGFRIGIGYNLNNNKPLSQMLMEFMMLAINLIILLQA